MSIPFDALILLLSIYPLNMQMVTNKYFFKKKLETVNFSIIGNKKNAVHLLLEKN